VLVDLRARLLRACPPPLAAKVRAGP
jgi:hypothetical protein